MYFERSMIINMLNVFLVDDEYFERTALKKHVPWEENGFRVVGEANNGKTAYRMISELSPDIAIVDINIPGYSGLELIEKLCQAHISCRYVILTGYDTFSYAQKALKLGVHDYILKPINYGLFVQSLNELKEEINRQHMLSGKLSHLQQENENLFLERCYNDLVNCNFTTGSLSGYDSSLAKRFQLNYPAYGVIVFDFPSLPEHALLRRLQDKLKKHFTSIPFVCFLDVKKRIFLITDSSDEEAFSSAAQSFHRFLQSEIPEVIGGAGLSYPILDQLYLSYNEACIALKNHSLIGEKFIFYKSLPSSPGASLESKVRNQLRFLLLNRSYDRIRPFLSELYDNLMQQKVTFDCIALQTMELTGLLTEILSGQAATPISVLDTDSNILDTIGSMKDISEIKEWLIELYLKSLEKVNDKASDFSDTTICIEKYIVEHLSDPELSIAKIASGLYLNYSYICYRFKQDKNMTINDFINQARIEKAVSMFHEHIDNISYVAEQTGFNNAGYFSKKFKKATGLSPSEYIKTIL